MTMVGRACRYALLVPALLVVGWLAPSGASAQLVAWQISNPVLVGVQAPTWGLSGPFTNPDTVCVVYNNSQVDPRTGNVRLITFSHGGCQAPSPGATPTNDQSILNVYTRHIQYGGTFNHGELIALAYTPQGTAFVWTQADGVMQIGGPYSLDPNGPRVCDSDYGSTNGYECWATGATSPLAPPIARGSRAPAPQGTPAPKKLVSWTLDIDWTGGILKASYPNPDKVRVIYDPSAVNSTTGEVQVLGVQHLLSDGKWSPVSAMPPSSSSTFTTTSPQRLGDVSFLDAAASSEMSPAGLTAGPTYVAFASQSSFVGIYDQLTGGPYAFGSYTADPSGPIACDASCGLGGHWGAHAKAHQRRASSHHVARQRDRKGHMGELRIG